MVGWASGRYAGSKVRFLMLCVEQGEAGLSTARWFGQQFKVPESVVNGYIDTPSEAPTFGQLGCGGFIVLGPHGQFVAPKTVPAFMQAGDQAFVAVEKLLSGLGVQPNLAAVADTEAARETPKLLVFEPPIVGNAQMDKEHVQLSEAVAAVQTVARVGNVRRLRDAWAEHSAHEEALFARHDFGGHCSRGALAGTTSHCKHHREILALLDSALKASEQSVLRLAEADTVDEIVSQMQRHSDLYDSAYAGQLPDLA